MLSVILWIIFLGSLAGIGATIVRKFPRLVLLDVESITSEREKRVKYELVRNRLERAGRETATRVRRGLRPLARVLLSWFRALYDRVLELERRHRSAGGDVRLLRIKSLIKEARELAGKGDYRDAERRYVEVVSIDPKFAKAYEELGRLAVQEKRWKDAEEAFVFVLKLNPEDASAHANYGELETARGNVRAAVLHFEDAVRRKPASPKYLSFLLEAAIMAPNRDLARETFGRLKEVNPENQKLPQLEQKIREM